MLAEAGSIGRFSIDKASPELVEPIQQVVKAAMRRVRNGYIDDLDRQAIALKYGHTRRLYLIQDVSVSKTLFGRRKASTGTLDCGLFVSGVQLNEQGDAVSSLVPIQIPRDINFVTQENLFCFRGSDPKMIELLAQELSDAERIEMSEYSQAEWFLQDFSEAED